MARFGSRRGFAFVGFGLGGLVLAASASFGCASLAAVEVTPNVVKPGQEVRWKGTFFAKDQPVVLRWNALDGPVLATGTPPSADNGLHGNWRFVEGTFTIPASATAGTYLVIATQDAVKGTNTWGIPARTLVNVSDGTPALGATVGPPAELRPGTFVKESAVSGGTLVLIGFGAAGAAMLLAGIVVIAASGRAARPVAARVRAGGSG